MYRWHFDILTWGLKEDYMLCRMHLVLQALTARTLLTRALPDLANAAMRLLVLVENNFLAPFPASYKAGHGLSCRASHRVAVWSQLLRLPHLRGDERHGIGRKPHSVVDIPGNQEYRVVGMIVKDLCLQFG